MTALAAARATRFITTDWLGEWLVVGPAKRWADATPGAVAVSDDDDRHRGNHAQRLVSGLDCPFCVGFWLGAGILLSHAVAARLPVYRPLHGLVVHALALNYVTGHLSRRIDT